MSNPAHPDLIEDLIEQQPRIDDQGIEQGVIDPELLERMARIARGLPGHVVSVDGEELVDDWGDTLEPPP